MSLLPVSVNFFKLSAPPFEMSELTEANKGAFELGMSSISAQINSEVDRLVLRSTLFDAIKQLIVTGNSLLFIGKDTTRSFRLNSYVVKRDWDGTLLEIIIKETVSKDMLPQAVTSRLQTSLEDIDDKVDLYTYVRRKGNKWVSHQETLDIVVPKSTKTYSKDSMPYIALRYTSLSGEDYGRTYIDDIIGDLSSLENLTKAIVEASLATSKVIMAVKPNGHTRLRDVQKARNLDIISGSAEDVTAIRVDKGADLSVASNTVQMLEQRLAKAFLVTSSVQRKGERVTAEEIRLLASELEASLGGVYTLLAQELQLPLARLLKNRLESKGKIPRLPDTKVRIQITTGIDALSRNNEREGLEMFITKAMQLSGGEAKGDLNFSEVTQRLAASYGVDTKGLIKTPEEKQAEAKRQQKQMQMAQASEAMKNATPQVAGEVTKGIVQGMQGQPQ